MAFKRADRVNSLLQRELATLISEELRDPRIVFATVTSVETTGDLRLARIFVSVLGDDTAAQETMRALDEAKPYIRHEIGSRTDLRFVPDIEFVSDRSAARAARISTLLRRGTLPDPAAPQEHPPQAQGGWIAGDAAFEGAPPPAPITPVVRGTSSEKDRDGDG